MSLQLSARAYTVPTEAPEGDGTLTWSKTTLVLAQASCDGVTGLGFTYGPPAAAGVITDMLAHVLPDIDPDDIPAAWRAMQTRLRNAGRPGIAGLALSAADCALWDLKARRHDLPLARLLDARDLDVRWFEEPVSSDDLPGLRRVRDHVDADVAAGEYGFDLTYFAGLVSSVDCLQIDVTRCGGISEFHRAAAVAAAHNLQVSGHCAPHQHLAVAAATPNLRHLEWFHDHVRIERLLFDGGVPAPGGLATVNLDAPGNGLTLRESDAEPYRVA